MENKNNRGFTWVMRVIGLIGMFLGLLMFFGPMRSLCRMPPWVGVIANLSQMLVAGLGAIVLLGLIAAAAWFYYRPVTAISAAAALTILTILAILALWALRTPSRHGLQ